MPHYLFHVFNNDHTIDENGRDFPDMTGARDFAIKCIREIMAEEITKGEINLTHRIEIENEQGEMHVVPFSDAVRIGS